MADATNTLSQLATIARSSEDRVHRAKTAAEEIRRARGFHWVGLYDVTPSTISAIAWTGATAPAFPTFPRTQGLNGAAVAQRRPLVINDVRNDPRYLTTFGSTLAEAIFPVRSGETIVGTIDVENDRVNAFTPDDEQFLQRCADALVPLWSSGQNVRSAIVSVDEALSLGPPPPGNLAVPIFARGSLLAEMYTPTARDDQQAHDRDEVYFRHTWTRGILRWPGSSSRRDWRVSVRRGGSAAPIRRVHG